MKDERSIAAADMAIKYGEGNATDSELAAAADAAYDATAAYATAAYAAYATAAYAAYAADAAAYAAAAAAYAAYAADAYAYARKKSQQETAEICRKYIPFELILSGIKSQEKQKA